MRKQKGERKIIKFAFGKKIKSAWLEAATCATAESVVLSTTVSFKDEVLSEDEFLPFSSTIIQPLTDL